MRQSIGCEPFEQMCGGKLVGDGVYPPAQVWQGRSMSIAQGVSQSAKSNDRPTLTVSPGQRTASPVWKNVSMGPAAVPTLTP